MSNYYYIVTDRRHAPLLEYYLPYNHNAKIVTELPEENPDAVVVLFLYREMVDPSLSSKYALLVNCHPSLLPAYRGAAPIPRQMLENDYEFGFTVHTLEQDVDTGSIVYQQVILVDLSIANQYYIWKAVNYIVFMHLLKVLPTLRGMALQSTRTVAVDDWPEVGKLGALNKRRDENPDSVQHLLAFQQPGHMHEYPAEKNLPAGVIFASRVENPTHIEYYHDPEAGIYFFKVARNKMDINEAMSICPSIRYTESSYEFRVLSGDFPALVNQAKTLFQWIASKEIEKGIQTAQESMGY